MRPLWVSLPLAALVAGSLGFIAAVTPAQAQNQLPPVAIASLEITTEATDTTPAVVTLDGSASFDPDGSIVRYEWEVLTAAYSWLYLNQANPQSPVATFELPAQRLIERFGWSIEFRLTVTDNGRPAATDSDTVRLRINQPPVADIHVTAKLFDHDDVEGNDDNRNGVADENEERYPFEGVINRPGEGDNDDNEWNVRDATLLVVDGSGSFDPDGELTDRSFTWELLRFRGATSVAQSLPIGAQGQSVVGQRFLSTDEDPNTPANPRTETVARLPFVYGEDTEPFLVYYRLTVTDQDGASARQIVKIVIERIHDDPEESELRYTGAIDGPDYCINLSLGGPPTHPFDSDADGVADTCSLRDTRRAAVARQTALEQLAELNPDTYRDALFGVVDDPLTPGVDESTEGACALAPVDLGDTEDELRNDACGRFAADPRENEAVPPQPEPVDAAQARVFYSGAVDGPTFCANHSLGGPVTYPFDSNGDGIADVCALPYTRREAVARHNALRAAFADHPRFPFAFFTTCAALAATDFGDSPDQLATDACNLRLAT